MAKHKKHRRKQSTPPPSDATGRSWIIADPRMGPRQSQKPQDLTVESYMRAMASIYQASKAESGERKRDAIMLWQRFRDARVFHFEPEVYNALHHEADRYTTEDLAGYNWRPHGIEDASKEESEQLRRVILGESKKVPYPEKFPFPSVFVGYGAGLDVLPVMLEVYAPANLQDRILKATVLGHIMTEDGFCATVFEGVARSDEGPLMSIVWFDALRDRGQWTRSEFHLEPWILPSLINIINDHRTFILETPLPTLLRRQFKRDRKSMGLENNRGCTPPPYYTLRMQTKLIREKARKELAGLPLPRSYKTDRRAHERCRIARGHFPLDPELSAKFRKRGYKLFTTQPLDADTLRRLQERGQPFKRADEWLAILTSWVAQSMTSNDPALPYIPAVRLPGKVRTQPRRTTGSWVDDPQS